MKVWDTNVLKEIWYYNDFIGEDDPTPYVAEAPEEIPLEFENAYMDAFAFVLSSREENAIPKNITLNKLDI
jgi:hypothetical protein